MKASKISDNLKIFKDITRQIFSEEKRIKEGKLFIPPGTSSFSIFELLALKNDIKPSVRLDLPFNQLTHSAIKNLCEKNRLFLCHSDYKFISNSNLDVSSPIPFDAQHDGLVFYYISKDEKTARELKRCDRGVDFERFSSILGYPQCCIEFAKKLHPGDPNNHVHDAVKYDDYLWSTMHIRSFRNSKEFSFYLNKYTISALISHTPCHLNCKGSKIYAKKLLSIIKGESEELARIIEYFLKLPSIFWNYCDKIVFQGKKNGKSISYHDFFPSIFSRIKFSSFPDHEFSSKLEKIKSKIGEGNKVENSEDFIRMFRDDKMIGEFMKKYEFECILTEPNTD